MESQCSYNLIEIGKESIIEKIFRIIAVVMIILFPVVLLFSFKLDFKPNVEILVPSIETEHVTMTCFKTLVVVTQYKRAVILRFGRVRRDSPAGPGIIWVVPCTDTIIFIDLRTFSFNMLPQEIITKDFVTVTVDAVVYYHVQNPLNCLLNVQTYKRATKLLAVATLRNILGQYTLAELLTARENISNAVRKEIDKGSAEWGVQVERVEIKDVILPYDLQKAMAAEAEGQRIAKAKIIEAEGEIKAAENLKEASKLMVQKPQTMILRYLQTLNFIASQQSTSIIFPFPIDIPKTSSG